VSSFIPKVSQHHVWTHEFSTSLLPAFAKARKSPENELERLVPTFLPPFYGCLADFLDSLVRPEGSVPLRQESAQEKAERGPKGKGTSEIG
jgi:hypothetical protein